MAKIEKLAITPVGITGRIAPGTDIRAIRMKLQEEAAAESDRTIVPNQAQNNTIIQVPSLSEVRMPRSTTQGDIRMRHVTGEAKTRQTMRARALTCLTIAQNWRPSTRRK
jgi:hypothetical protein